MGKPSQIFKEECNKVHTVPRGFWCDILVLSVHVTTRNNIGDVKNSLYSELDHAFCNFLKHHMEISLGEFSAKVGRQDILKSTIGNDCLHEINVINKEYTFLHPRIPVKSQFSHIITFINLRGHLLMERQSHWSYFDR
jgi:hypothetical protein